MLGVRRKSAVAAIAAALAAVLLVQGTSWAGEWKGANATLINIDRLCRDGVRFEAAAVSVDVETIAVAARHVPRTTADALIPDGGIVPAGWVALRQSIAMKTLNPPEEITVPGSGDVFEVGKKTERPLTLPFTRKGRPNGQRLELPLADIGINLEGFRPQSEVFTARVEDCYLFAPIDVTPGNSANPVPVGGGWIEVAVLGTRTFKAEQVNPLSYRLGRDPAGAQTAAPLTFGWRNVSGDGRKDLVLRFSSVAAGIDCLTRQVKLTGQTASGGILEGRSSVRPANCSSS
jgi:hypothetical protein